jgi:uncharacterized protein (TIGR03083 family)
MTALLTHLGRIYRWVGTIVATKAAEYVKVDPPALDGFAATLAWFEEELAQVLATLAGADPDEAVWNWFDRGPAPARFWVRRMAHETAMHRWDAELGAGDPHPIAADLAVDGVDEFVSFADRWLARTPVAGLDGSLHLHATDTDGEWFLQLSPGNVACRREHAKADAALRGPASDLLLWMLNRVPADAPTLQVFGDRGLINSWGQLKF